MAESEQHPDPTDDNAAHRDDLTGGELSRLVDDIEKRVEAEHDEEGTPGSASDREATEPVEPDDKAPE